MEIHEKVIFENNVILGLSSDVAWAQKLQPPSWICNIFQSWVKGNDIWLIKVWVITGGYQSSVQQIYLNSSPVLFTYIQRQYVVLQQKLMQT